MELFSAVVILLAISQSSFAFVMKNLGENEDELVAVAVLYRDGDRAPTRSYPTDQFYDESYWPLGLGQLTQNGKVRQYQLGEWLRTRYNGFLSEEYDPKDIYVLSTDTDRTLMSAQLNLAGLYPPKGIQLWNKNILWQPIPVHTMPTNQDQILYMERPCPRFNQLYAEVYNNSFFQNINAENAGFYQKVSELTGWEVNDVSYIYKLQQVLSVYAGNDESLLPEWYSTLDLEKLKYLAGLDAARYTFTDELKKLGDGPFFDDLFTRFDRVLGDTQSHKFVMYSGHESTLGSVLNGMGVFDYIPPKFASCFIWEVRKDEDGDHYVNLLYKRDDSPAVDRMKLPSCDYSCKYETFKNIMSPFTLDLANWDIACMES